MATLIFQQLTPQQEAEALTRTEAAAHERPRRAGDRAYLVSNSWFQQWLAYVGYKYDEASKKLVPVSEREDQGAREKEEERVAVGQPAPRPGPVDSSDLVDASADPGDLTQEELATLVPLRPHLREKHDYWVLHEVTWNFLVECYKHSGPLISREYVEVGQAKRLEVDPYCRHFKVIHEHSGQTLIVPALAGSRAIDIKTFACQKFDIDHTEHALLSYPGLTKGEPLTLEHELIKTTASLRLRDRQALLLRRHDHSNEAANAAARRNATWQPHPATAPLAIPSATPAGQPARPMPIPNASRHAAAGNGDAFIATSASDTTKAPPPTSAEASGSKGGGGAAAAPASTALPMSVDAKAALSTLTVPNSLSEIRTNNGGSSPVAVGTLLGPAPADEKAAATPEQQPNTIGPVRVVASTPPALRLGGAGASFGTSPTLVSGSPLSRSFGPAPVWAEDVILEAVGRRPGLAGLGNVGNTCFMNSSLQCLAHTVPLMQTFLSGNFRKDLNRDNPLGLGGKLASAYGGLMTKLWKGGVAYVTPKHFKWQLAKFAPQFVGYAQQDSQELLAFLLDGLHEDLNRIKDKPYREEKDSDGRPDAEVAAEAWQNYRARNDSVVVDHFQGLYKSSLRCPQCRKESVKFDPFMYLSLPLPAPQTRSFTVTILDAATPSPPIVVSVDVQRSGKIMDIITALDRVSLLLDDKDATPGGADSGGGGGVAPKQAATTTSSTVLGTWGQESSGYYSSIWTLKPFFDEEAPLEDIPEPPKPSFFAPKNPPQLIAWRTCVPSCYAASTALPTAAGTPGENAGAGAVPATAAVENGMEDPDEASLPGSAPAMAVDTAAGQMHSNAPPVLRPVIVFHKREYATGHLAPPTIVMVPPTVFADAVTPPPEASTSQKSTWTLSQPADEALRPWIDAALAPFSCSSSSSAAAAAAAGKVPDTAERAPIVGSSCSLPPLIPATRSDTPDGAGEDASLMDADLITAAPPCDEELDDEPDDKASLAAIDIDDLPSQAPSTRPNSVMEVDGDAAMEALDELEEMDTPQGSADVSSDEAMAVAALPDSTDGGNDGGRVGRKGALSQQPQQQPHLHCGAPSATDLVNLPQAQAVNPVEHATTCVPGTEAAASAMAIDSTTTTMTKTPRDAAANDVSPSLCAVGETAPMVSPSPSPPLLHPKPYMLTLATLKGEKAISYTTPKLPSAETMLGGGGGAAAAAVRSPLYLIAEWSSVGLKDPGVNEFSAWKTPVQHPSAVAAAARSKDDACKARVTLTDCVDAFCQLERLDAADSWYCSNCKSHVRAEKKLDLWRLPEVLVVHLKRFSYSRTTRDKLDTEVDFPVAELDLRKYVPVSEGGTVRLPTRAAPTAPTDSNHSDVPLTNPTTTASTGGMATTASPPPRAQQPPPAPVYDLYAVSNHFGGLGGGHYTAFCRMPDDEKWYVFDDSTVNAMEESHVASPAAYVLFYRRRGASKKDANLEAAIKAAGATAVREEDGFDLLLPGGGFGAVGPASSPRRRASGPQLEQVGEEDADAGGEEESEKMSDQGARDEPLPGGGGGGEGVGVVAHALPLEESVDDQDEDDINMEGLA